MDLETLILDVDYYHHRMATLNWEIGETIISFTDLTYVIDGEADYEIDGNIHRVKGGELLCIPPGSRRKAWSFPEKLVESQCMNVRIMDLSGQPVALPLGLITPIGPQPELNPLFYKLSTAWLTKEPGYRVRSRAYAMLILDRLLQIILYRKNKSPNDHRIFQVMTYVAHHYSEPIPIRQMAALSGLSPMYFGTIFRQQTGMPFRRYVNSIRLNHAENMLSSGEFNVSEVASACGFSDVFYFSKVFKELRGISPSKVKHHRREDPSKRQTAG